MRDPAIKKFSYKGSGNKSQRQTPAYCSFKTDKSREVPGNDCISQWAVYGGLYVKTLYSIFCSIKAKTITDLMSLRKENKERDLELTIVRPKTS